MSRPTLEFSQTDNSRYLTKLPDARVNRRPATRHLVFFFIIIITFGQKKMKYVLEAKGEMTILRRCNHRFLEVKEKKEKE